MWRTFGRQICCSWHLRMSSSSSCGATSGAPLLDDAKELCKLTKQGLISRVLQLQEHIEKTSGSQTKVGKGPSGGMVQSSMKRKVPPPRQFSFSKYGKRRIALKFAYLGCDYDGFACQTTTDKTIEHHVLEALKRTRLIRENENCFYSKAGRTDKGVSALEQVISLNIRSGLIDVGISYEDNITSQMETVDGKSSEEYNTSKLNGENSKETDGSRIESQQAVEEEDEPCFNKELKHVFTEKISLPDWSEVEDEKKCPTDGEIGYLNILNRNTPSDIMFYAWAPVPKDFSARFHCSYRQYKYFFPKCQLDLELMRSAGALLVGKHNYQNFCKIDRTRQQMFERSIWEVSVEEVERNDSNDSLTKCCFTVKAEGFLYHQVRYMMSVLFSVGLKLEPPEIVSDLLNLKTVPEKPQYVMASEQPLILHEAGFPNIKWLYDQEVLSYLMKTCRKTWTENFTKQCLTETLMEKFTSLSKESNMKDLQIDQSGVFALSHSKGGSYVPIKDRQTRPSTDSKKKSRKRNRSSSP
ncbi:putative tRNA pseudouridine synthase tag-124 [Convolutriloba macropyga]|uniref:putative tRNA pseudouridine synthase tag-124 n=1 Tax=Convolutriloba macropyga TaxID=536237 RepID=UPI003F51FEF0